jgi:anti-sigma factor RsiW
MSTYQALSCQELVELVTDYLEDTLPAEERERFEAHLDDCGPCRTYLDQMRATIELTGSLPTDSIPPEAQAELLRVFRDWRSR